MDMRGSEIILVLILAAAATPALGQTHGAAAIPDFAGMWWHPSLPGFEPMASGPRPVTNRSRRRGVSNYDQLVGDYTNPILKPDAAQIVKKHGEISLAGVTYPNPANQCWPEPVPFIYKSFGLQILQSGDHVTMIYDADHQVRHVRMNQPHPAKLKPSWYGDSVGHYEGDTLVIDTVGTRVERPYSMLDLYGTPFSKALHVVERYRLVDYDTAKDGLERDAKENQPAEGKIDRSYRGKHLQLQFTVEDEGVFTSPWTATVTYAPASIADVTEWPENVCAENTHEYYNNKDSDVPTAKSADF
jgi:hypothetical protein